MDLADTAQEIACPMIDLIKCTKWFVNIYMDIYCTYERLMSVAMTSEHHVLDKFPIGGQRAL